MNLVVRPATPADAAALAEIYAPSVLQRPTSFELHAPDADEMAARLARVTSTWPWFVAEQGGQVLGYCYASAFAEREAYRWSVTTTAYVRDGHHRRGIGRALYARLLDALRRQGAVRAFAGITLPNEDSVGLHRAMGFEPVGLYPQAGFKLGRWWDVAWYGLALREVAIDEVPAEPVPWPKLGSGG